MAIVSVKAGRCKRRGETNWVDPQPAKGRIEIEENDGLLTFCAFIVRVEMSGRLSESVVHD